MGYTHSDSCDVALTQSKAIASLQQGNWQDAAELSDRVLHLDSAGYPSAYYVNAMANLRLGKLDPAEKSALEAIRLDGAGRNARTKYVLGLIVAQKHDFAQAAGLLHAYLKALPNARDAEIVRRQLRDIEKLARSK
jgi:tetratricopeptide (TPR) repeat protein